MLKVVWPDNQPPKPPADGASSQPAHTSKDHILLGILLHTLLDPPVDDDLWLARDANHANERFPRTHGDAQYGDAHKTQGVDECNTRPND